MIKSAPQVGIPDIPPLHLLTFTSFCADSFKRPDYLVTIAAVFSKFSASDNVPSNYFCSFIYSIKWNRYIVFNEKKVICADNNSENNIKGMH